MLSAWPLCSQFCRCHKPCCSVLFSLFSSTMQTNQGDCKLEGYGDYKQCQSISWLVFAAPATISHSSLACSEYKWLCSHVTASQWSAPLVLVGLSAQTVISGPTCESKSRLDTKFTSHILNVSPRWKSSFQVNSISLHCNVCHPNMPGDLINLYIKRIQNVIVLVWNQFSVHFCWKY